MSERGQWKWLEESLIMCILAGTRDVARRHGITQYWFMAFGYAVWGCPWPDGLWSRP